MVWLAHNRSEWQSGAYYVNRKVSKANILTNDTSIVVAA
jgi:hypothetical protein